MPQTVVIFGNPSPQHLHPGEDVRRKADHLNQAETRVEMWEGFDDDEFVERSLSTNNDRILTLIARTLQKDKRKYAVGVSEMEQILAIHSGGESPDWVASSDPDFAKVLGKHFGCPATEYVPKGLLTNVGRDQLHTSFLTPAYMALANSTTATTPAATDTTLAGEINTAGGGLIRASATVAHTAGTNTSTVTKTFTANGSDVLPVTASQMGVFTAVTGGQMLLKTPLNSSATLNTSGDNVTITETANIG